MLELRKLCTLSLIWLAITTGIAQSNVKVRIAAASDLKFAMDSVILRFAFKHTDILIEPTYGSSGKLFEQISHGAPFDLFFSADIEYPEKLKTKGLAISEVYTYGIGRIVIWSAKVNPEKDKMNCLLDPLIFKIAIANPAHAPYGKRAEEALRHYKLLEKISSRLVYGENISQTAQFVTSGAADAGIVALSLALSPGMKKKNGHYYIIPEASHQPLIQGFVLLDHAKGSTAASAFRDFMLSSEAKNILRYFGFAEFHLPSNDRH